VVRHLITDRRLAMARVTVINDSPEFLELMRFLLDDLDHDMVGLEAVRTSIHEVADTKPDLLVIDLRLANTPQEVSGWELMLLARSHRDLGRLPIILCTADVRFVTERADDLAEIAGVHVITKPFDLADMEGLIERLLAEAGTTSQAPELRVLEAD
jgi:CheY-like chemotaxis protein